MRRSLIATAAVGGTLALASSASAIQIPMGTANDTPYSGTGTPSSIYSIFNASYGGLKKADQALNSVGDTSSTNSNVPNYSSFPPAQGTGALTSVQALSIAADFSGTTVTDGTTTENPSSTTYSAMLAAGDPTYSTDKPAVISAAQSWGQLQSLVTNLGSVSSVLNSADTATVSSSGTVTSATSPMAYSITLNAPSGGYILPSAFTLTFPAGLSVNTALVGAEVNAAANGTSAAAIAAIEANPTGTPIGTVTLTSPLADAYGGTNNQLVGKIYVVQTGAASGQGSVTQPYLELWFAPYIYNVGSFPSSLAFPLTLQFGLTNTPLGLDPLPTSSLVMSFPAATSPVKSSSCTNLGTVTATATDDVANLALAFGDTSDGLTSPTGTPAAVNLAATPTAVTNQCPKISKAKNTAFGIAAGLPSGHPTLRFRVKAVRAFRTVSLALPRGMKFMNSKRLAKQVSAAKVKSVRIVRGRLVITLRGSMKVITIQTKKGLISETNGLIKSIRKHKTKMLMFTLRAGNAMLKVKVKA